MKKILIAFFCLGVVTAYAEDDSVIDNVQCWANGAAVSQGSGIADDINVNMRLVLRMEASQTLEGTAVLKGYIGHIALNTYTNETKMKWADRYAQFTGKNLQGSLSPRARVYKDSHWYRFNDFDAAVTNSNDGGQFWGYLVVEKKALDRNHKTEFKAKYVGQSGDHFGGTIHLTCSNQG